MSTSSFLVMHLVLSLFVVLIARQLYRKISHKTGTNLLGACLATCAASGFIIGGFVVLSVGDLGRKDQFMFLTEQYAGIVGFSLLAGWLLGWIVWAALALTRRLA